MNIMDKAVQAEAPGMPPDQAMVDDGEEMDFDENNPGYLEAKKLMMSKLYEEDVGKDLMAALQAAPDPASGIAEQSLMMLEMIDQMTDGSVPDEMAVLFSIEVTSEVAEIAEAGGVNIDGQTLAKALQMVIAGVIQAYGGDAADLSQAMASLPLDKVGAAIDQAKAEGSKQ